MAAGHFGLALDPMFGAVAMSLSSFCVVTNALRLNLAEIKSPKHDRKIRRKMKQLAEVSTEPLNENEMIIKVDGMMCEHCEKRVKDCLEALSEIESAESDYRQGTVKLVLKGEPDLKKIKKAITSAGYKLK